MRASFWGSRTYINLHQPVNPSGPLKNPTKLVSVGSRALTTPTAVPGVPTGSVAPRGPFGPPRATGAPGGAFLPSPWLPEQPSTLPDLQPPTVKEDYGGPLPEPFGLRPDLALCFFGRCFKTGKGVNPSIPAGNRKKLLPSPSGPGKVGSWARGLLLPSD